jgi:trigger factor
LEGTKKEGQLHKVGSQASVLGLEIDSHVGGKKAGDALEISQPYPASHPDPRVAGKSVLFTLTIKSVKEKKLPALDDEFAKDCGPYNSLQEIKNKLREGMEQALKREIEDNYKDTIVKRLMDTHHFDLPETLVERELEAIIRQHVQQQQQRKGGPQESPGAEDLATLRQEHRDEAARRVKVSLVLEEIAQKEGLTVTQDDFNSEIGRLASELKMPVADLVKMIKAGGQESIDDLRTRILVDKALDFVYRNAVIQG